MSAGDKNRFDELFKKGLDVPEDHFEFNEADWDNMETQLPGEKKTAKIFPLRSLAIAASVLVALVLGWLLLGPANETKQQVVNVKQGTEKRDSIIVKQDKAGPAETGTIDKQSIANEQLAASEQVDRPTNRTDDHTGNRPAKSTGNTMPKAIDAVVVKDDQLIAQNTLPSNAIAQPKDSSVIAQAQTGSAIANAGNAQQAAVTGTNNEVLTTTGNDNREKLQDAVAVPSSPKKDQLKTTAKGGPVLAISVILSPNFNGVGSLKDSKMGKTAGLLFSVGVGNKLSVSTGAVYHQVPYATDYSNYISTYRFYTKPVGVMADCRVLDIPLTVDYKLYNKGANAFNVGAGLSSYFMLKETYNYEFAAGHAYGPTSFTVNNQNKHIFGVLDLSATYQRKLNNKLSLGLQPYLKLPLTDIGNNRVRLQTAGVALAVSWTIINKNP